MHRECDANNWAPGFCGQHRAYFTSKKGMHAAFLCSRVLRSLVCVRSETAEEVGSSADAEARKAADEKRVAVAAKIRCVKILLA